MGLRGLYVVLRVFLVVVVVAVVVVPGIETPQLQFYFFWQCIIVLRLEGAGARTALRIASCIASVGVRGEKTAVVVAASRSWRPDGWLLAGRSGISRKLGVVLRKQWKLRLFTWVS